MWNDLNNLLVRSKGPPSLLAHVAFPFEDKRLVFANLFKILKMAINYRSKNWIFTIQVNEKMPSLPPETVVIEWLQKYACDAIFQEERGKTTGRLHYQGRLRLSGPRITKSAFKKQIEEFKMNFAGFTFAKEFDSASSNRYCVKSETRTRGPWRVGVDQEYLGKDLNYEFRPWQQSLAEFCRTEKTAETTRSVVVVYDRNGNSGKSWWVKKMRLDYPDLKLFKLPTGNYQQLMSIVVKRVHEHKQIGTFCVDLTRTRGKDLSLDDIYHAIEDIKSGYVIDTMYGSGKEGFFEAPNVIIMTNRDLHKEFSERKSDGKEYLSSDRYWFLEIVDRNKPIQWQSARNLELIRKYIPNVANKGN